MLNVTSAGNVAVGLSLVLFVVIQSVLCVFSGKKILGVLFVEMNSSKLIVIGIKIKAR
jgi:hypothetical protein